MRNNRVPSRTLIGTLAVMLLAAQSLLGATATGTTTVTANIAADASITVSSPTTLTTAGAFASFTGSTTVTFSIRTTKVGGSGKIELSAVEFAPAGGPTIAAGNLTYSCSGSPSVGTLCGGPITALTSNTAVLSSIGADAKANGTGLTVNWTLANSPTFSTGAYSSTVTFTLTSL